MRPFIRIASGLAAVLMVAGLVGCADLADPSGEGFHPDGWVARSGTNFHGKLVLEGANKATECTTCHGENYEGNTEREAPACTTCHAAYPHEVGFDATLPIARSHAKYMREHAGWDLSTCTSCHGSNYNGQAAGDAGPIASKSCLTCHEADEGGPEACNTCHGGDNGAPPPDLFGGTDSSLKTVGAHERHLDAGVSCETCHVVPETFDADGHIDGGMAQAEIVFSGLAINGGAAAIYDATAGTCASSYCHGGFSFEKAASTQQFAYLADAMVGNNPVVEWTGDETQVACGTCHGLPPTGHLAIPSCSFCHGSVIDSDNVTIKDPSKHMNGQIDMN
jgi:predicted CxxxxCH...CXXCH cytochrome family protein